MADAQDARSERAARAIVEAARSLVQDEGLPGFSSRAVARRAGVSPGTLAYYFPKTDDLIDAVVEPVHDAIAHTIADAIDPRHQDIATAGADAIVALYRALQRMRPLVHLRMSRNLQRGAMSTFHLRHNVFPALEEVGAYLSGRCDLTQLRLAVHSLAVLAMRYVLHPQEELRALADPRATSEQDPSLEVPDDVIERHLALVARGVFAELFRR